MAQIYIFGDQTVHADSPLQDLLHVSDNSTLSTFLFEAYLAIRQEISRLPANERVSLPQPETLGLLLDATRRGKRHPALESALVCLYEIGEYIRYDAFHSFLKYLTYPAVVSSKIPMLNTLLPTIFWSASAPDL